MQPNQVCSLAGDVKVKDDKGGVRNTNKSDTGVNSNCSYLEVAVTSLPGRQHPSIQEGEWHRKENCTGRREEPGEELFCVGPENDLQESCFRFRVDKFIKHVTSKGKRTNSK